MKTVLVVGSSRGIGLEFCKQYAQAGWRVLAACRTSSPELKNLKGVEIFDGAEVKSLPTLQKVAEKLKGQKVDVLIHNAGIFLHEGWPNLNMETIQEQFLVNAMGPLHSVMAFSPLLEAGSKIALITSRMGSIDDNTSGGYYGYRMSKAALNAAGRSLAIDMRNQGIHVVLLHPGYVKTDMTQHQGDIEPSQSVRGLIQRINELDIKTSGTFWHTNGEMIPW